MADSLTAEQQDEDEGLDLAQYKRWWSEVTTDYATPRQESLKDRDYKDGFQWDESELLVLADRGQPDSVFNIIARKVDGIVGVEIRTRSEPRAFPRTPQDQKASEIATDTLRYVKEKTRWMSIKTAMFEQGLVEGYAAVEIGGAQDDVPILPIPADEFFFDPRSRRADFSDARYLGTAKWVDADLAAATFGDSAIVQETLDQSLATDEFKDRPDTNWGDRSRKRVFIVDMWHVHPQNGWMRCVFTGAGKLAVERATMLGPDGAPRHPIEAFSIFVTRKNWRYGVVRQMRSPQDEVNKRRSAALWRAVSRQLKMRKGAMSGDKELARKEAARPDGVLEYMTDPKELEYLTNGDQLAAHVDLMNGAIEFMERLGPNPQLLGEAGTASSGRAILALQQAGLGELGVVFERLRDWELRCYRLMWARIRQFWTAPMYVRVTDDAGAARFAPVNGAQQPVMDQNGQPQMEQQQDPFTGQTMQRPQVQTGPMLADLDMDIIIDAAPEAASLQAEQFETLAKLAQNGVPIPPDVLIEMSTLPNKTQVLDKLKQAASQPPNPQQQMQMRGMAAQVRKTEAEAVAKEAEPMLKSQELDLEALNVGLAAAQKANEPPPVVNGRPPLSS